VHVQQVTQPQGHSTSGSHERYKSDERLQWERDFCCINKMREWLLEEGIADSEQIGNLEQEAKEEVRKAKDAAWDSFLSELKEELQTVDGYFTELISESGNGEAVKKISQSMKAPITPLRRHVVAAVRKVLRVTRN